MAIPVLNKANCVLQSILQHEAGETEAKCVKISIQTTACATTAVALEVLGVLSLGTSLPLVGLLAFGFGGYLVTFSVFAVIGFYIGKNITEVPQEGERSYKHLITRGVLEGVASAIAVSILKGSGQYLISYSTRVVSSAVLSAGTWTINLPIRAAYGLAGLVS
jgi:hypothetical protein